MDLHFRWIAETEPGPGWAELAASSLEACRAWYLRDGNRSRPSLRECRAALRQHVPELVDTWQRLVDLLDEGPVVARMLSLWCPPAYAAGCSQAVWSREHPLLVRNYDYHPLACEGASLTSAWTPERRVIASLDCLWGALDGMNSDGLAVSLAFGSRRSVGKGFGIPLILRYVLETCATTEEALSVLRRVPSHMAYNVSVLDASGDHAVACLAPRTETRVRREAVATNHQAELEWPLSDRDASSLRRERHLAKLLRSRNTAGQAFLDAFLAPPLYATDWAGGYGTIYTVAYQPDARRAEFRWPDQKVVQSLDRPIDGELIVGFGALPAKKISRLLRRRQ